MANNQLKIPKPHAHVVMTQMNVREDINKFGEQAYKSLLK